MSINMVDLRLTRPLPPTVDSRGGAIRPPAAATMTSPSKNGKSTSGLSSLSLSPNRMKIEQSEEVQLTPEQVREKRAGK